MAMQVEKLTISLPRDLVQLADAIAKERKISRSKLVASCIKEMADKRLEERMIEGYKATAKTNLEFAESSVPVVREVIKKD
jgi:metal-responsive CopG/Arc/MetJ family transcriptional regulator